MVDTYARLRACTTTDSDGNVVIEYGGHKVVMIPKKSDRGRSTHEMLNDSITELADLLNVVLKNN